MAAPARTARRSPKVVGTDPAALDVAYETAWGTGWLRVEGADITVVRAPTSPSLPPDVVDAREAPKVARELAARLTAWFDGDPVELATPARAERWLDVAGVTGFARRASSELVRVPRGVTIAYGELAALAGAPGAARAAGTACAHNPLWLVVPCHRVIASGGRLGGYGDLGTDFKRRLLELEGRSPRA